MICAGTNQVLMIATTTSKTFSRLC